MFIFDESRTLDKRPINLDEEIEGLDSLLKTLQQEYGEANPGPGLDFSHLAYVGRLFVWNGWESIFARYSQTEQYSGELRLRLSVKDDKLRLEVEDNGTGIDARVKPYLFQSKVSTKEYFSGFVLDMGDALSDAKDIIKKELRGEVGYKDKGPNQGAIFWYEVPLELIKRTG